MSNITVSLEHGLIVCNIRTNRFNVRDEQLHLLTVLIVCNIRTNRFNVRDEQLHLLIVCNTRTTRFNVRDEQLHLLTVLIVCNIRTTRFNVRDEQLHLLTACLQLVLFPPNVGAYPYGQIQQPYPVRETKANLGLPH